MANNIKNLISVSGKNADKVLTNLLEIDDDGKLALDFNKIIPMPKELNIPSSTRTEYDIEMYLTYLNPNIKYIGKDNTDFDKFEEALITINRYEGIHKYYGEMKKETILDLVCQGFDSLDRHKNPELNESLSIGEMAINNIKNFRHMNWYKWRVCKWGTKCNAYETMFDPNKPTIIMFETAWDCIPDLLTELSKQYPKNTFYYEFSDEDKGRCCGYAKYKNGKEFDACMYQNYSNEADEFYEKVWEKTKLFEYNEESKTYKYLGKEHDEEME